MRNPTRVCVLLLTAITLVIFLWKEQFFAHSFWQSSFSFSNNCAAHKRQAQSQSIRIQAVGETRSSKAKGFSCEGTLVEGNLQRHGRSRISAKRGGVDETCSYIGVCRNGRLRACRARSCRGRRAEIRNRH